MKVILSNGETQDVLENVNLEVISDYVILSGGDMETFMLLSLKYSGYYRLCKECLMVDIPHEYVLRIDNTK